MEIFFLVLLALVVFFWMLKKESQKVEKQNLEHIRFLYEKTNQMASFFEVQKQLNDFYKTANDELKGVQQEIKGLQNLHKILSDELQRLRDMFDVIPMPDGKPHEPNKFVWTWDKFLNETSQKKPKDHLKVVKLKNKKGKKMMEIITKTIIEVNNELSPQKIFSINLGIFLRKQRLDLKKTQTWVAKHVNVTFQQIQKYEKGTNSISVYKLLKLWNVLKIYQPLGDVLLACQNNEYLKQIFMTRTDEFSLRVLKEQVINSQVDYKKFDAFIDIK